MDQVVLFLPLSWMEVGGTLCCFVVSQPRLASNQDSFDCQPEEIIKGLGESHHPFSVAAANKEQAILVKFAAHRT